ncbi:hypothetical protein LZW46_00050 [Campylobacter coli]|nr:hypothetical protein [Campylobacter coli]MCE7170022.1 hypothetical protein [Campylobacter coli]MCH3742168.1 hypothetical protein [Campylobacter coli]
MHVARYYWFEQKAF